MKKCDDKMTEIYQDMTTICFNSGKRVWMAGSPGRALSPQSAVHFELNTLYSEGEHDRQAKVNGTPKEGETLIERYYS